MATNKTDKTDQPNKTNPTNPTDLLDPANTSMWLDVLKNQTKPPPEYKKMCESESNRPEDLRELNTNLEKCSSESDKIRNTDFSKNTTKLQNDIVMLRASIGDSLLMGDSIYGTHGVHEITNQVQARNKELKRKKDILKNRITKSDAIIERSNRDFSDVRDTIQEPEPKKLLHFIEDYTVAFLSMAYLFMLVALNYLYVTTQATQTTQSPTSINYVAILRGIFGSGIITVIAGIIFYYVA